MEKKNIKTELNSGDTEMLKKNVLERYLKALLSGDRVENNNPALEGI